MRELRAKGRYEIARGVSSGYWNQRQEMQAAGCSGNEQKEDEKDLKVSSVEKSR